MEMLTVNFIHISSVMFLDIYIDTLTDMLTDMEVGGVDFFLESNNPTPMGGENHRSPHK